MARVKIGNVRTPIDYLKKFFAPAGHGLGEVLPIIDKAGLDNWTSSGWCIYYDAINPDSTLGSSAFVNCKGSNTSITGAVIQEAYQRDAYGVNILTRVQISGEWQPWEWINPPMTPGVEYRTTERWNNKPVYIKSVELGNLPDTANSMGTTWVDGSFYGSGVKSVIACGGCLYKGDEWAGALPYVSAGIRVDVVANSTTVGVIASDGSFSDRTATVWVKYTKN